ncbi:MAG: hypothetical protein ABJE66_22915 [Deltaproteobacteria bacterium]
MVTVVDGNAPAVKVGDTVVARLVEDGTAVMFAVADLDERDQVIASDATTYFTTTRYRELAVVLARLAQVDQAACRARLERAWRVVAPPSVVEAFTARQAVLARIARAAEVASPIQKPTVDAEVRYCYWLALWTSSDHLDERRRFIRYPAASMLDWFASGWRTTDWENWPPKLRAEERYDLSRMFSNVLEDGAAMPTTSQEVLDHIRNYIDADAESHLACGRTDDDEGTYVEYFIFDDELLTKPDALDRLPNPDRGAKQDDDDGYRALIEDLRRRAVRA